MGDEHDLDILEEEVEVEPTIGSRPRLLTLVGGLVVIGLLIGVLGVVVANGLHSVATTATTASTCTDDAACSVLSLDDVRSLTGINFPDESEVIAASYDESAIAITMTAHVRLPESGEDPFDNTAYHQTIRPAEDWPVDDLDVNRYYAATGEQGTLKAEAVYAVDAEGSDIVLVVVRRDLS